MMKRAVSVLLLVAASKSGLSNDQVDLGSPTEDLSRLGGHSIGFSAVTASY